MPVFLVPLFIEVSGFVIYCFVRVFIGFIYLVGIVDVALQIPLTRYRNRTAGETG